MLIEPLNRYEIDYINTLQEANEFIEQIGCDNVKILADLFHMNIEEKSIEAPLFFFKDKMGIFTLPTLIEKLLVKVILIFQILQKLLN